MRRVQPIIRRLLPVVALLACVTSTVQAQSFSSLWKQVERAEQQGLPQTVVSLTDRIFRKGEQEKNTPQMLKAYLCRAASQQHLTPDSFYVNLRGLELWAQQETQPVNRAVLHSLLASMYADYADNNGRVLWQRAFLDVTDADMPADIREWSSNLFLQQVMKHTRSALEHPEALLNASTQKYVPFTILGESSSYYGHDMYHLLVMRAVAAITAMERVYNHSMSGERDTIQASVAALYHRAITRYRQLPDREDAVIMVTLDSLKSTNSRTPDYLAKLNDLIARYGERQVCAEVYLAKVDYLYQDEQTQEALLVCNDAIARYPKYKRINVLRQSRDNMLKPFLNVYTDGQLYPGDSLVLRVSHRNLAGFTLNFLREKDDTYTLARSQHFSLLRADYMARDTLFRMVAPDKTGSYSMQVVPDSKQAEKRDPDDCDEVEVTRLKVLTIGWGDTHFEVQVVDTRSGLPVSDVLLQFYQRDASYPSDELMTGKDGRVTMAWNPKYTRLTAEKGDDRITHYIHYGVHTWNGGNNAPTQRMELLTDRAIYRPGQTIYIKGIDYKVTGDTAHVLADRTYNVVLRDANRKEIAKQEVRTNDFGSFTTAFVLPSACLNGRYVIDVPARGTAYVQVESYKRPSFELLFDTLATSYQIGDSIQLHGRAVSFNGVLLQGQKVAYTVLRSVSVWGRGLNNRDIYSVADTVTTASDGSFVLPLYLAGSEQDFAVGGYYAYTVNASLTNQAGETQRATVSLTAGTRSLQLSTSMDGGLLCKDNDIRLTVYARNLNDQPVATTGDYTLSQIIDGTPHLQRSGRFTANVETVWKTWAQLPSGRYELLLTAKDSQGRAVECKTTFALFSYADNRPADRSDIWAYTVGDGTFDAAHPAQFCFGTSFEDAYILLDVFCENRRLERRTLQLSDSIIRFEVPYQAEYGDGVQYLFAFVKNGKLYTQQFQLTKRLPDKKLPMKWSVFRDKLRPGQTEEWRLTVGTPQGTPADAELLAVMYDASLDKLYRNNQSIGVGYARQVARAHWDTQYVGRSSAYPSFTVKAWKYDPLYYDTFYGNALRPSLSGALYGTRSATTGSMVLVRGVAAQTKMAVQSDAVAANSYSISEQLEFVPLGVDVRQPSAEDELNDAQALRTNFSETAFFYPQLRTDAKGEVSISFTLPESLTRWNFRGYAHTRGMLTGQLEATAVAAKDFMLQPNMPRFVRVGDVTSIAASISNLTGNAVSGKVRLVLFDPMTDKQIRTQQQPFTVEAGATGAVSFRFTATDKYDMLGVRLIADGGTFSDGEQHLLPVLSDKEYITETLSMPIRGNQTRTFSLDSLFNGNSRTATERRLTVEFTGNPAWLAVQALPVLSQPQLENATSWATALYANTLAAYILGSQPRIKAVMERWKAQAGAKGGKESFLSSLEKNQDLKNILLEESPWLLEATTESERQSRLATLFDVNTLSNGTITALTKLKELQRADGSWGWYKGMWGNRSMTVYITELLVRLPLLTGQPHSADALSIQQAAFNYLHKQLQEEYTRLRKAEKSDGKPTSIPAFALDYLYLVARSGGAVPADNQPAYRYFLDLAAETAKHPAGIGTSAKANLSVVLQQSGHPAEAAALVASLKEHLVQTDERGAYFAFNETPYLWGMFPVSVHVATMEALRIAGGNDALLEEMKIWLLKQKQATAWNAPVATADAVYALLCQGNDLLASRGEVSIRLDRKALNARPLIPGLGYVKESFGEGAPEVNARQITVTKPDAGIAYGAVYAQYLSPIADIKSRGGELSVDKKLYVERTASTGRKTLQLVSPEMALSVGDRVVARLTIRLDRAMDFIQLKDRRGACFEPETSLSGYRWNNGIGYYVEIEDAATNFFFDSLSKGVYVLEYSYRVARSGTYEGGLSTIQCAYAPEYA
ncbi:MAG: alpha-2-macroglobulin, partial [Prevotellaceae bacterium]|nr:alpha-2-macroglobulin [Prevotellaceae bacterium]